MYFYPVSKEVAETIDYDTLSLPTEVNIVCTSLYIDNTLIGFDDNQAVNQVEGSYSSFEVPTASIKNTGDVRALVEVEKLSCLGDLCVNVPLGADPDVSTIHSGFHNLIGGVKIDSVEIRYTLEGKKTKKLSQITLSCILTNTSQEKRMVMMCVSAMSGDPAKLISKPSGIFVRNSFAEETTLVDPGKSAYLKVNIFSASDKFAEIGITDPIDCQSLSIYPLLKIYGGSVIERKELTEPTLED